MDRGGFDSAGRGAITAYVSVHDVMPETLPAVRRTLAFLADLGVRPVPLLVVPGRAWSSVEIGELRSMSEAGHELVGHGWYHEAPVRGLYHRLHSATISKNVAEHLAHDERAVVELVDDCFRWFIEHDFPAPRYYVPPAWAMGGVGDATLASTPFEVFETQWGFTTPRRGRFQVVPLVGFEADDASRVVPLRLFNRVNGWLARRLGRLRVAIHPYDIDYPLRDDLASVLRAVAVPAPPSLS